MEEDVAADIQTAALSILSLLGLCLNGLIFLLFYRKHNMRTFSNRFVLSLATSHMLQCLLIIPAMIISIQGVEFNKFWCRATTALTIFLNLVSVFSILLVAVDRNCAVNSPLHYTLTITKKRTGLLIGSTWSAAFILTIPVMVGIPETSNNRCLREGFLFSYPPDVISIVYSSIISFVGFILPFVNVACLYFAMFKAARNNNARARRSSSNSSASNEIIVNLKPAKKQGVTEYTLRRNFSSDHVDPKDTPCCFAGKHKAAVTGLMVVVSFVVCWLPFFATLLSDIFVPSSAGMKYCVNLAAYTSCILNPYLYFFRNKNTWKESKKMVKSIFTRKGKFDNGKSTKKNTIDLSCSLFRLPSSQSQPVLTLSTSHINTLCADSASMNMSLKPIGYLENKPHSSSSHAAVKPLLHQDSSTSNDSSDACATTVVIGSVLSIDEDSMIWYQPFRSGMVDVPLHQNDTV
ncbi:Beta-2 adrenergic receptor like protein [Argiope bruennichi]|uniref:Beta-2 adrenergic receptor like protein n=1 Tax=Argiope bruennichi TaxID=94029 RepID=A0A8T0E4F4_ARGBR|nr:Beta-2 adrenergic receptor like protein [Argiope bruennichi]